MSVAGPRRRGAGAVGAVAALLPIAAEACAVCVGWGGEGQGLNPGFYWSALVLTALPFVIVGAAGLWLRRLARPGDRAVLGRAARGRGGPGAR